jgi:hypothetical protein
MSTRQTGQRKNKNVREADPKPKGKRTRNRGTRSKAVPKEGGLGTLFDEVEAVAGSLQFLNQKELKSYRSMSSRRNSESRGNRMYTDRLT